MDDKIKVYKIQNGKLKFVIKDFRINFYNKILNNPILQNKYLIKRIQLILLNSKGEIIVQLRNESRVQNPGMFDKSVGGHVVDEDSYEKTLYKECDEELGIIPIIFKGDNEYKTNIQKNILKKVALVKEIGYQINVKSLRVLKNNKIIKVFYIQKIYLGYYDGNFKFNDNEVSLIKKYSLKNLKDCIKKTPELYTYDLKQLIKKYSILIKPINKV
ncbi:MAG: NUDIX domain-containing protein [Nanoarchaeales archaeon]|nr:NUDIX domain-containing protein [Nanoarchaeales archaeon]